MSLCGASSFRAGPTALFGRVDSATLASPQQRHKPPSLLSPVPSILFPKIRRIPTRNHDLCASRIAAGSRPILTRRSLHGLELLGSRCAQTLLLSWFAPAWLLCSGPVLVD